MTVPQSPDLRRAGAGDATAVQQLAERAYTPWIEVIGAIPQPMEVDYREVIGRDDVWITGPADRLAGSLVLKPEADHLLLWSIAVDPELKGNGLGNVLLRFTLDQTQQLGLDEVRLFTNIYMASNRAWYQRKGFRETGEGQFGDKHVVYMSLSLNDLHA